MSDLKTETKVVPITRELAGNIADALDLPMKTTRCVIDLNWQKNSFTIAADSLLTDDEGRALLEVLKRGGA